MQRKATIKQAIAAIISVATLGFATATAAAEGEGAAGFYGGVSLRDQGTQGTGLQTGAASSVWNRFTAPAADDSASRALVFGGYRWTNDVAVEASFTSVDKYALRPADAMPTARRGVGLGLVAGPAGAGDVTARSWNVDVYTSWAFYKAFALYGRLGYAQSDALPQLAGTNPGWSLDPRRLRDGVNYGVGLRYDMTRDLGLRLEYARFGRYAPDLSGALPESDQVTFGVQFRF